MILPQAGTSVALSVITSRLALIAFRLALVWSGMCGKVCRRRGEEPGGSGGRRWVVGIRGGGGGCMGEDEIWLYVHAFCWFDFCLKRDVIYLSRNCWIKITVI